MLTYSYFSAVSTRSARGFELFGPVGFLLDSVVSSVFSIVYYILYSPYWILTTFSEIINSIFTLGIGGAVIAIIFFTVFAA